jgi:hypothetical protein
VKVPIVMQAVLVLVDVAWYSALDTKCRKVNALDTRGQIRLLETAREKKSAGRERRKV